MPMDTGNRASFSSKNANPNGIGSVNGVSALVSTANSVSGVLTGTGAPTGAGLSYSVNGVVGVGAFR
jgi:hypothetical protein